MEDNPPESTDVAPVTWLNNDESGSDIESVASESTDEGPSNMGEASVTWLNKEEAALVGSSRTEVRSELSLSIPEVVKVLISLATEEGSNDAGSVI